MPNNPEAVVATPTVKRRIISMVYEAFLLLAVEMLATALYMLVTGNRQDPVFQHGRNAVLFLVALAYFVHFWTDSGHTLAMKTWRIKVVQPGYASVPLKIAVLRYFLAWGWFLPALLVCSAAGLHDKRQIGIALLVGMVAWALTAFFDKDRQFLHDKLAGTRLVSLAPRASKAAEPA
jgi:uncharacterized RDD family membrane protein YckC